MAHQHNHSQGTGNLKAAFFLNLAFTIIEIIGGFYTNSLAILSDALHDLGDSLSLGLSWYFQNLSNKGRTQNYSYGYKRFSLLGAIINAVVLAVGSVFILTQAVPQLFNPEDTHAEGMLYLAILGVIINGAAVFKLRKGESMNEKVVSLHLLEDVLGWAAVLVGSILMMNFDAPFIDPLLSILISLYVIYNVFRNLKKSMQVILQATPPEISLGEIKSKLLDLSEIIEIHDLHVWSLDGNYNVMSVHVRLEEDYKLSEVSDLKEKIRSRLHEESIEHVTIEVEGKDEDCSYGKSKI